MRSDTIDLTNKKFNRLTVLSYIKDSKWLCKCICGKLSIAKSYDIRTSIVVSCGCYKAEKAKETHTKHGHTNKETGITATYRSWDGMIQRCTNENNKAYNNYGGRGIIVCKQWLKFNQFLIDMGEKPKGRYSLERVNNDGNYEPTNCKWILLSKQHNNKRTNFLITYKNKTQTLSQWANQLNMHRGTLRNRIVRSKWTIKKAFETPIKRNK